MAIKHLSHKSLLVFFTLVIFAVGVALFLEKQASAADDVSTAPINGTCSSINGTRVASKPIENLCAAGNPIGMVENNVGWVWKCAGINSDVSSYCSATKDVSVATTTPTTTLPTSPTTTTSTTATMTPETTSTQPSAATTSTTVTTPSTTNADNSEIRKYNVTATVDKPIAKEEAVAPTASEQQQIEQQQNNEVQTTTAENSLEKTTVAVVEKSQIIKEPIVVEAKNLVQANNPKVAGVVDDSLKVEKVDLVENDKGDKKITLSGKAEPNEVVTVYIFSNDPIVITLKADASGSWNYELDKELADGQHEVYVTVADDAGKIVSKSEPIAFVKTAQAASMIPMSEFKDTQSPMKSSAQQFVLMAIMVMLICLAICLAAIGFLTHKKSFNEGIN